MEESCVQKCQEAFLEEVASELVHTLSRHQQETQGCPLAVGFTPFLHISEARKTSSYISTLRKFDSQTSLDFLARHQIKVRDMLISELSS